MKVLAIIPARGGSKGIPRKNMRLMNGKPLIAYAIENALACPQIDSVVVSSDSDEILSFSRQYSGIVCLDRKTNLAADAITLDPVIYDAVVRAEEINGSPYDVVVTLQPTSPLLTKATLCNALQFFLEGPLDSAISVVNSPHLSWRKDESEKVIPSYVKRLNRQQLPPNYLETGAFLITKREFVSNDSRLGKEVGVFEVPSEESVDIDTKEDWVVCESLLSRKKVVFRVDGYKELGLGHVYRSLTLAYELIEHDVIFLCNKEHRDGIERLKQSFMPVVEIEDDRELLSWLEYNNADIFINDCLDTSSDYVSAVKKHVGRFVSFEDLGEGARLADAVVNAIYENAPTHTNVFTGKRYVCLRDEFLVAKPSDYSDRVNRVLVMFGGTDPLNLTARIYELAKQSSGEYEFDFVLGPGYDDENIVSLQNKRINVHKNVLRVTDYMVNADIAFSSQGRTTFELASMGIPTIVLAQNKREQLHSFAQMDNGFINLGLGSEVSDDDILATFRWLASARSIRKEMRRLMLENDLKNGINRVKRIILGD